MASPFTAQDEGPLAPPEGARRRGLLWGLVRVCRPRQWLKNLLVFAAPGAAGVLGHRHDALVALATFGVFCCAATGTYFLNDTIDAAADREHPTKRSRPVAAGDVPAPLAASVGAALLAASIGLAWATAGGRLALVVGIYVAITTAYSLWLKHEPVLDLACVAAGFVLRAVAGGVATNVPLSVWFIIVTSFGALLVVTGKRSGEQSDLGVQRGVHPLGTRPTLAVYPAAFLRSVRLLAAAVAVTGYCIWAFGRSAQLGHGHHPIWFELSIAPFVLAVLHLELRFEQGHGAAPEELALTDHTLQLVGLVWVALVVAGIYA